MDIRLKTEKIDFDGKTFEICCNMNVLADIQEKYNGKIKNALDSGNTAKTVIDFFTAMLNDYADDQGWDFQYTSKQVGRKISPAYWIKIQPIVMDLVSSSMEIDNNNEEIKEDENEKK